MAALFVPTQALVAARQGLTENEVTAIRYLAASAKIWYGRNVNTILGPFQPPLPPIPPHTRRAMLLYMVRVLVCDWMLVVFLCFFWIGAQLQPECCARCTHVSWLALDFASSGTSSR